MDPANLFHQGQAIRMHEVMEHAFELLGRDLVLAHAKDLSHDGHAGQEAAGTGILDYDAYIGLLWRHEYAGPLILHSLHESQVASSVRFLKPKMPKSLLTLRARIAASCGGFTWLERRGTGWEEGP